MSHVPRLNGLTPVKARMNTSTTAPQTSGIVRLLMISAFPCPLSQPANTFRDHLAGNTRVREPDVVLGFLALAGAEVMSRAERHANVVQRRPGQLRHILEPLALQQFRHIGKQVESRIRSRHAETR